MDVHEFTTRVIERGIEAARHDYTRPDQAGKLRGSIDGFELCRGLLPHELQSLYIAVNQDANQRMMERAEDYWYWRCRAMEVEWVCNVVSAVLINQSGPPILSHLPTARGVMTASKILAEPK